MKKYFTWCFENQCKSHDWDQWTTPIINLQQDLQWAFDYIRNGYRDGSIPSHFENTFYRLDWAEKTSASSNNAVSTQEIINWIHDEPYQHLMNHAGVDKIQEFNTTQLLDILADKLNLQKKTVNVYCHNEAPGQVFPMHFDRHKWGHFSLDDPNEYNPNYGLFIIFFDDWQHGQAFQMGTKFLSWKSGDVFTWSHRDTPHGSSNFGYEDRMVLLVNGEYK